MTGGILGSGSWTRDQLLAMPTIRSNQSEDLKVESETERIWVSRLTKRDGAAVSNRIIVQHRLKNGEWA